MFKTIYIDRTSYIDRLVYVLTKGNYQAQIQIEALLKHKGLNMPDLYVFLLFVFTILLYYQMQITGAIKKT